MRAETTAGRQFRILSRTFRAISVETRTIPGSPFRRESQRPPARRCRASVARFADAARENGSGRKSATPRLRRSGIRKSRPLRMTGKYVLSSLPDELRSAYAAAIVRSTVIAVTHRTSAINQLSSIGRGIDGVRPHTCRRRQRRSQISNNDSYPVYLLAVLSREQSERHQPP